MRELLLMICYPLTFIVIFYTVVILDGVLHWVAEMFRKDEPRNY